MLKNKMFEGQKLTHNKYGDVTVIYVYSSRRGVLVGQKRINPRTGLNCASDYHNVKAVDLFSVKA